MTRLVAIAAIIFGFLGFQIGLAQRETIIIDRPISPSVDNTRQEKEDPLYLSNLVYRLNTAIEERGLYADRENGNNEEETPGETNDGRRTSHANQESVDG